MIFKMICSVVENQLFSRLSDIIGVESGLTVKIILLSLCLF